MSHWFVDEKSGCKKIYALSLVFLICLSCGKDEGPTSNSELSLTLENGRFDVDGVVVEEVDSGTGPRGSGSLSFDFSGDATGSFSASGSLTTGQAQPGVGAVISKIENIDLLEPEETLSLLAFSPTSDDKADVFIIGGTSVVDSLTPGLFYPIGPTGFFTTGLFLRGIDITTFWVGSANLFTAADQAFRINEGGLVITMRNGSHITGTFAGTTQVSLNRASLNPIE